MYRNAEHVCWEKTSVNRKRKMALEAVGILTRNFIIRLKLSSSHSDCLHIFPQQSACTNINIKCYQPAHISVAKYSCQILLPITFSSVRLLEILNLTSLPSPSGSGPRHTHWKGTQSNSTIVKHTKAKHLKPFLNQ